ncbi:hypothetical protein AX15_002513 [Amanita polypyramis BW_CC]|nr:hypothetical protein AX15_002513 [Amanita polypyramis BW_CC]
MENKHVIRDSANDDAEERQRFDSFKLGKGLPSSFKGHKPGHSRSHSRNTSISSVSSLSLPLSRQSITLTDDVLCPSSGSPPEQGLVPSTRRNSHHRRRSSVSTRHESAEMMGMSLPDLPPSHTEDNVNLGEKDSIRRRALWALEGKPDVSYSKVEIPELSTPQMEKIMSEFPTKPSFPPGSGMSNLLNKRDSFKLLSSASSTKDQLHTLVEEEEEDDDGGSSSPNDPNTAESLPVSNEISLLPALIRPRPTSLHLRPLSLTPEKLSVARAQVPSPLSTPTPRNGLRSFSLSTSTCEESTNRNLKYRSFNFPPRSHPNDDRPTRRSSISYITSSSGVAANHTGLPTPEATPNHKEQHFSWTESLKNLNEDEFFLPNSTQARRLSASEQHFLIKSHNALLTRITDLERALSLRMSSGALYSRNTRPASLASDISLSSDQTSTTLGEPNDEILQLLADLKAERDEYKRDVDAWRERVNEMDNKLATMAKRVEVEGREAWIARSRVSLLASEKATLEKTLECNEATLAALKKEKMALVLENQKLHNAIMRVHADLTQVKEQLERAQQKIEVTKQSKIGRLLLGADLSDGDNCLIGYEGEEGSDVSFKTSSSDSIDEPFVINDLEASMLARGIIPSHVSDHSLSKSWTFPSGTQSVVGPPEVESDMDKFFGCLEDPEDEATTVLPSDLSEYSYERSKGLFSEALRSYNDDQDAPFIFSTGLNTEASSEDFPEKLPSVLEEEDEHLSPDADEDMFGEANASFTASPSEPPVLPPLEFDHNGEDLSDSLSFKFSCYEPNEILTTGNRSPTAAAFLDEELGPVRNSHSAPPRKRAGVLPSLIPRLVASPSPIRLVDIPLRSRLPSSPLTHNKQSSLAGITAHKKSSGVTNENHAMRICQTSMLDNSPSTTTTRTLVMTNLKHNSSDSAGKQYTSDFPLSPYLSRSSLVTTYCRVPDVSSSTSSRLSLHGLTTLIPSSWTPRIFAINNSQVDSPTHSRKPGNVDSLTNPPLKSGASTRKYVPREVQVEKLRLRLAMEGLVDVDSHCKKCHSKPILL